MLGGTHTDGYCSKLGYARPLGWGSVRIEAKALLLLDDVDGEAPTLKPEADLVGWVKNNYQKTATQDEWLAIHRRKHPNAEDYPRKRRHQNLHLPHDAASRALANSPLQEGMSAMTTLLIMTTARPTCSSSSTAVRRDLTGTLWRAARRAGKREFRSVDAPTEKEQPLDALPEGEGECLHAEAGCGAAFFDASLPTTAIVFETRRMPRSDPRFAGAVLERRLAERIVTVRRHAFLKDEERLEDASNDEDAVTRRSVVGGLSKVIADAVEETKPDRIFVATTGGLPAANDVIEELVRLHAVGCAQVTSVEVPDAPLPPTMIARLRRSSTRQRATADAGTRSRSSRRATSSARGERSATSKALGRRMDGGHQAARAFRIVAAAAAAGRQRPHGSEPPAHGDASCAACRAALRAGDIPRLFMAQWRSSRRLCGTSLVSRIERSSDPKKLPLLQGQER